MIPISQIKFPNKYSIGFTKEMKLNNDFFSKLLSSFQYAQTSATYTLGTELLKYVPQSTGRLADSIRYNIVFSNPNVSGVVFTAPYAADVYYSNDYASNLWLEKVKATNGLKNVVDAATKDIRNVVKGGEPTNSVKDFTKIDRVKRVEGQYRDSLEDIKRRFNWN